MTGRIDRLQKTYEIEVRWTAFPLHPETPEEGQTLEQLFAGRLDIDQVMVRLKQAAQNAGLPFTDRKMTYNSRMAQELAKWAESKGKENEFHKAVFQAYFVQGLNIGKRPLLAALADSIELSGEEAGEVLRKRIFKAAVDADWDRSRQLGIQAVPTLVLDRCSLVGAQPYEKMVALLDAAGIRGRKEEK